MYIPSLSTLSFTLLLATLGSAKIIPLSWEEAYSKAEVLVNQMSLEQKVTITTGTGWGAICSGVINGTTNPFFPSLCLQDSPLGVRATYNVTSGVSAINAAASFDKQAMRDRGDYIGKEFRGKGVHIQLGPAMNYMRSPLGGRAWESGGEDPYLMGVLSAETVKGVQEQGVICSVKHYLLNEQELNRSNSSTQADARTMHEIYLWPFARSVEAGVGSVMCSYNEIDGTYACESDYMLNTVLKGELGFKGFVMSDWGATQSTVASVNGGLDMTMPTPEYFGKNLTDAVNSGKVSEERATDMAMRIVAAWYKMRQDTEFPSLAINSIDQDKAPYVNVQEDHHKLVREMGAASNVLLKNVKNTLPINIKKLKKVAIIGSDSAVDPKSFNCDMHACTNTHLAQGWGSGTVSFPYLIDPLTGLKNAFGKDVEIKSSLSDWDLEAATDAAKGTDYAFVFANANSGEEIRFVGDTAGDRNNLSLWNNGDNLVCFIYKNTCVKKILTFFFLL